MILSVAHINPHNFSRIVDLLAFKYFYFIKMCLHSRSTTFSSDAFVHDNQYTEAYVVRAVLSTIGNLVFHLYLFDYPIYFSSQSAAANSFVGHYQM